MNPFQRKYNPYAGTHCWYCEREFGKDYCLWSQPGALLHKTQDHILAQKRGGPNTLRNKIAACTDCNQLKSGMLLRRFAITINHLIKTKSPATHPMYKLFPVIKDRAWKLYNKTSKAA